MVTLEILSDGKGESGTVGQRSQDTIKKGDWIVFEREDKTLSKQETRVEDRRIQNSLWSRSSQAIRE